MPTCWSTMQLESAYKPVVRPGTWIRSREPWTYVGVGAGLLFVLGFGYAAAHAALTRGDGSASSLLVLALFLLFWLGLPALVARQVLQAGVRIARDGVTVRGVTKTVQVPLDAVEGFVPRRIGAGGLRSTMAVALRRRGGRDVLIWALRHGEYSDRRHQEAARARWQPTCEELEALVASLRASG